MKKFTITLIVLAAVAVTAGAYYQYRRNGGEPQVSYASVSRGNITDAISATGTLGAVTTVQVGTQVSGTVDQLFADFNSIVRAGQIIAKLEPSLFQTQVEQAQANLIRAEADVERLKVSLDDARRKLARAEGLSAKKLIPETELETAGVTVRAAEAQLKSSEASAVQAKASVNQSQVNLAHTIIRAPIDGIVISRNVDVGQTVAASMQAPTLFILAADLTKMQVNANIDEADVGRIRPAQRVRFRVDAHPMEEFDGQVAQVRLQPVVAQNVVTYATVINVPNPELKLKPGMTANVTIEIARRQNAVRVPNTALRFRPNADIFAAFNQQVPPDSQQPGGGRGSGRGEGGSAATSGPGAPSGAVAPSGDRPSQPGQRGGGETQLRGDGQSAERAGRGGQSGERGSGRGDTRASGDNRARENRSGGRGDGRGGFGGGQRQFDPERRRQFLERSQGMSPEEREQMTQRMRDRSGRQGRGGGSGEAQAPVGRRNQPEPANPAARQAPSASPQTIDSLFGPLPQTETSGRVWIHVNNQLKSVRVRLGISDGNHSELLSGEIQPGTQLVTNVTTGSETRPSTSRSPLMGPGGGRGGPGGGGPPRNQPPRGGGGRG